MSLITQIRSEIDANFKNFPYPSYTQIDFGNRPIKVNIDQRVSELLSMKFNKNKISNETKKKIISMLYLALCRMENYERYSITSESINRHNEFKKKVIDTIYHLLKKN